MKQTAVEWLVKELESFGDPGSCKIKWEQLDLLIAEAKEIEKEQNIEFACQVAEASAMKYIQGKTTRMIAEELIKQQL